MQICVIQMGGTIDKVYPQVPNAYGFEIRDAQASVILKRWKNFESFHFYSITQKDSQDLDENDLKRLVEYINTTSYDGYLITHGTDTMDRTASYVKEELSNLTKTIALTGSRLPACVIGSDAELNIGMCIGIIESVPKGVFIVLDGEVREV